MINVLIIFDYVEYRQLVTKVKRDHHEEKIKLMNDSINYVTDIIRKNEEILLNEDVHHINENTLDNNLENLEIVQKGEHQRQHNLNNPNLKKYKLWATTLWL